MSRRALGVAFALLSGALVVLVLWGLLADPAPVPIEAPDLSRMVAVPAGTIRDRKVPAFRIDRFEVTEADWLRYAAQTGAADPLAGKGERRAPDYPIRHVTWSEARAYASWSFKRLPTNEEWELASVGRGGARMPWGEGYVPAANTAEAWERRAFVGQGVTRVGIFAMGRSRAGAFDMVGNVWEWTDGTYRAALHDPRYLTDVDYDRDEERFRNRLERVRNWPSVYALPFGTIPISGPEELAAPAPSGASRPLLEILPVLTPRESLELVRSTGFRPRGAEQFVLAAFAGSEEVEIWDLVEDLLIYERVDPRVVPVLDPEDVQVLASAFGAVDRGRQYVLPWREPLSVEELERLAVFEDAEVAPAAREVELDLEPLAVLDQEDLARLEAARRGIERRLSLIEAWKARHPELLRIREAELSGERHRIVRGGSFRTRIKGTEAVLEDLENAAGSSWDLGFRCVVSEEEIARQRRILPLVRDLGYRDPLNWLVRVRPAARALRAEGEPALPYLRHARRRCRIDWMNGRLDGIIERIEASR